MVNPNEIHPKYYENFDTIVKNRFTSEDRIKLSEFNTWKYLWRWREKNGIEDLRKAITYIGYMIEELQDQLENNPEVYEKEF